MPKKAMGENTKAVEAKARKADAMKTQKEKKDREVEDAKWEDDDKHLAKKQSKKAEEEKKRLEKLQRKNESKVLEEIEKEELATVKGPSKVTQAQIQAEREKREAAARKASVQKNPSTPKVVPLMENLNRLQPVEEATTVDEALKMLKVSDAAEGGDVDRHPERRVKAAYNAFEAVRFPILKAENPSLRMSQLKQMLFEEWKKSPDNPLNKERVAFNTK